MFRSCELVRAPSLTIASIAGAGCMLVVGCETATQREPAEPVRIGLMTSFTGQDQRNAQQAVFAAQLAIEEANASGGPLSGRPAELLIGDNAFDGRLGRSEFQRMTEEGMVALVGPETSRVAEQLLPLSAERQLPMVSCCATSVLLNSAPGHGARERYFFRTIPPDSSQAPVLARVMRECGGCDGATILHLDDAYGTPFAAALAAAFEEQGGSAASVIPYALDAANYDAEVRMAAADGTSCVAVLGNPADTARIRQRWEVLAGRDVRWYAGDGIVFSTFVDEVGSFELATSFLMTAPATDLTMAEALTFEQSYLVNFGGTEPNPYNYRGYDAAALILLAIAEAGSTEGRMIRDALFRVATAQEGDTIIRPGELSEGFATIARGQGINYEGASGHVDFDDYGNVESAYDVLTFGDNGDLVRLGQAREGRPLPCMETP